MYRHQPNLDKRMYKTYANKIMLFLLDHLMSKEVCRLQVIMV